MVEYKLKNGDILKDGHTMFPKDVVKDLNRKAYLEALKEKKIKCSEEEPCEKCRKLGAIPSSHIREVSLGQPPTVTLREDILKLHTLYLEKCDSLNEGERAAYERYLTQLSTPPYAELTKAVKGDKIDD